MQFQGRFQCCICNYRFYQMYYSYLGIKQQQITQTKSNKELEINSKFNNLKQYQNQLQNCRMQCYYLELIDVSNDIIVNHMQFRVLLLNTLIFDIIKIKIMRESDFKMLSLKQEQDVQALLEQYQNKTTLPTQYKMDNEIQQLFLLRKLSDFKSEDSFKNQKQVINFAYLDEQQFQDNHPQIIEDSTQQKKIDELKQEPIIQTKYILDQFNEIELDKLRLNQNDIRYLQSKYTNIQQEVKQSNNFPCIRISFTEAQKWFIFYKKELKDIKDCATFKLLDMQYQFYLLDELYCFHNFNSFTQPFKIISPLKNKIMNKFSLSKCFRYFCIAFTDEIVVYQIKQKNIIVLKSITDIHIKQQITHIGFYGKRYQRIYIISGNRYLSIITLQNKIFYYSVEFNKIQICLNNIEFLDHTMLQINQDQYYLFAITSSTETAVYLVEPFRQLLHLQNFQDDFIKLKLNTNYKSNENTSIHPRALWRCYPSFRPQLIISYWNKIIILSMKQFNIYSNPIKAQFTQLYTYINKCAIKSLSLFGYNQLLIHSIQNIIIIAIPLISKITSTNLDASTIYTSNQLHMNLFYKRQANRQIVISNRLHIFTIVRLEQYIDELIEKNDYRMVFGLLLLIYKQLNYSFQFSYEEKDLTKKIYYSVENLLNCVEKIRDIQMKSIRFYWICQLLIESKRQSIMWNLVYSFAKKYKLTKIFFDCLQVFILEQKIEEIQPQILENVIEYLCQINHNKSILKIMLKINLEEHDIQKYLHLIDQKHLYTLYIYLFQHLSQNQMDFFTPFIKIFSVFKQYSNKNLPQKQYFGNMCFWYLQKCLKGQKFPIIKMKHDQRIFMIKNLLVEILNKTFLIQLIKFNCKVLLQVILYIYADSTLVSFIEQQNSYFINKMNSLYPDDLMSFPYFHGIIIEYLKKLIVNSNESLNQRKYFQYFVALSCYLKIRIKQQTILESILYMLTHFQDSVTLYLEGRNISLDMLVLNMIKTIKQFLKKKLYIKKLLSIKTNCEEIKSYLHFIDQNYKDSIQILLHSKNNKRSIFQLINEILDEILDTHKINSFLEILREQVLFLVKLNPKYTLQIFRKYKYDQNKLLNQIRSFPEIKFALLNQIVLDNQIQFADENIQLLKQHLNLCCDIHPYKVLEFMKEINYPLDEGIKICEIHNHFQGKAFLEEKSGNIKGSLKSIQKAIKQLLKSNIVAENQAKLRFQLYNYFKYCIYLCKNNYTPSGPLQQENYWIFLLEIIKQFDSMNTKSQKVYLLIELEKYFNEVLRNIYNQVPLNQVIVYFTSERIKNFSPKVKITSWITIYRLLRFERRILKQSIDISHIDALAFLQQFSNKKNRGIYNHKIICGFCSENLGQGDKLIIFSCKHIFHRTCHKQNSCLSCKFQSDIQFFYNIINEKSQKNIEVTMSRQNNSQKKIKIENKYLNEEDKKRMSRQKLKHYDYENYKLNLEWANNFDYYFKKRQIP